MSTTAVCPDNDLSPTSPAMCHPAELMIQDIFRMDREHMICELMLFNDHCFHQFSVESLAKMSEAKLRRLLIAARHHYQSKGY